LTGEESVLLDFIPGERIDQTLRLPGEPGDHPNAQGFGVGKEAAVEAAAEEHRDSGGRETLEAPGPRLVADGQSADAVDPAPVDLGDRELARRAEPGGHVISVKRHSQHRPLLLEQANAVPVPYKKLIELQIVRNSRPDSNGSF
jgi:hypothetical protein